MGNTLHSNTKSSIPPKIINETLEKVN